MRALARRPAQVTTRLVHNGKAHDVVPFSSLPVRRLSTCRSGSFLDCPKLQVISSISSSLCPSSSATRTGCG